jgi:hypothetical protein
MVAEAWPRSTARAEPEKRTPEATTRARVVSFFMVYLL